MTHPKGGRPAPFAGVKHPGGVLPADLLGTRLPPVGGTPPALPGAEPVPRTDSLQVFPWWERPPVGFQNVLTRSQGLALAGAIGATVQGPSFEVPSGYSWVIRGINIFVQSPTPAFNVQYILRVGQVTLGSPYGTFGRTADSVEVPFPILEYGVGPTTIDILIVNGSADAWTVGASFTGWIAPTVNCNRTEASQ